jgi:hypothetical protein
MDLSLLLLGLAVGLVGLVLAASLGGEGRGWWVAALAVIAFATLGRLVGHGLLGLGPYPLVWTNICAGFSHDA